MCVSAVLEERVDHVVGWARSVVVLQEKMQVSNLVQHDWVVDNASTIDLIQLLNRVLFFQVEAEDRVELLRVATQASDQQDFGC